MLLRPEQLLSDARVRDVVRAHPWVVLVTDGDGGLLASHMPAVLDEDAGPDELVVLSHTARADAQTSRVLAGEEVLVVVQGEHGFLPGRWNDPAAPSTGTWNFEAVHVHGVPEVLDRAGSLDVLRRTFEHLETRCPDPTPWSAVVGTAEAIVGGTCCFRLVATRVEAKAKLGQDKPPEVRERLVAGLEGPGPYQQPRLAALMREAR